MSFPDSVVVVAPRLPPPPGGLQQFGLDVHAGLREIVQTTTVGITDAESPDGVRTIATGRGAALQLARTSIGVLRSQRPDTLLAMTWKVALPVQPFHTGLSVVYAIGAELVRPRGAMARLRDVPLRRADLVLAISGFTAELVSDMTPRPVEVVRPGVSLPVAPATRARLGGAFNLVSVGSLVPRKGFDTLIDAVARARSGGTDVRLTIVGDGPERAALAARVATAGVDGFVRLAGRVSDKERDALLVGADAFALLGRQVGDEFEGFGIVLLEAAAYGLPIITTRTGGTADAIADDNAIVVGSADEAADAIRLLHDDAGRADAMAAAGITHASVSTVAHRGEEMVEAFRAARQ